MVSLSYSKGFLTDLNFKLFNLSPVSSGEVETSFELRSSASSSNFVYNSPMFFDPEGDALVFTFEGLSG